nr:MAG TPA: hypothetical protein [Caudoviricetes sp.]
MYWAVLQQGKIKALHPKQMQGKRKARSHRDRALIDLR